MKRWIPTIGGYLSSLRASFCRKDGIGVFSYHGVVERKSDPRLERNLQLLSTFQLHVKAFRKFRILSLSELADELSSRSKYQGPMAVITFDDGYANNLLAFEILAAAHMPWSLFIPTGAIGRENSLWTAELSLLLLHGRTKQIEVFDRVYPLNTREECETAYQSIRYPLKSMPATMRRQIIDHIRGQFPPAETQRLLHEFPSLQLLSWNEINHLSNAGVEIGSHGVDHEIHHSAQPATVRRYELTESKAQLEKRLGRPCLFFAFPNGDFTSNSPDEVSMAGYKLAFTTQRGLVKRDVNLALLPRLEPPDSPNPFAQQYSLGSVRQMTERHPRGFGWNY
jgi:peptidoglycan/xylan/chitin deacetylase (PgdA/CDA1 family)